MLLDAPEIFDNGGAVPIRVDGRGRAAHRALQRRKPEIPASQSSTFGRLVPPEATIRIRLARSQTVYAVAEMADGTYREASQKIAVTVGGCG